MTASLTPSRPHREGRVIALYAPPSPDPFCEGRMSERCPICDWPMASRREDGCVPGDCSYRPREGSEEWRRIKRHRAELECPICPECSEPIDIVDGCACTGFPIGAVS